MIVFYQFRIVGWFLVKIIIIGRDITLQLLPCLQHFAKLYLATNV